MTAVAIIGTAGRGENPMTLDTFAAMYEDAYDRFTEGKDYTLVSGGAAWGDHLAVALFLAKRVSKLHLHLPAPLGQGDSFEGAYGSAGATTTMYHQRFTKATGICGIREIRQAIEDGAKVTFQRAGPGMGAFFARNILVAKEADAVLAYTWGTGKEPADGGTKHTWDQHIKFHPTGRRVHVPLGILMEVA